MLGYEVISQNSLIPHLFFLYIALLIKQYLTWGSLFLLLLD